MLIVIEVHNINIEEERNVILSADYGVIGAFDRDSTLEEIERYVYNNNEIYQKVKKDSQKYGILYALNVTEDKILDYVGVFFYNEDEDEIFIDCMEWDNRVLTSVAYEG